MLKREDAAGGGGKEFAVVGKRDAAIARGDATDPALGGALDGLHRLVQLLRDATLLEPAVVRAVRHRVVRVRRSRARRSTAKVVRQGNV